MKTLYYIVLIIIVIAALFTVFGKVELTQAQQEFKKVCESDGKQWMVMPEMRDGKTISDKACTGCCMADSKNMICGIEEYKNFAGKK